MAHPLWWSLAICVDIFADGRFIIGGKHENRKGIESPEVKYKSFLSLFGQDGSQGSVPGRAEGVVV